MWYLKRPLVKTRFLWANKESKPAAQALKRGNAQGRYVPSYSVPKDQQRVKKNDEEETHKRPVGRLPCGIKWQTPPTDTFHPSSQNFCPHSSFLKFWMYRVTGLYYKRDAMLKSSKGEVLFLHYSESCYERLWPDHPLHDSRYSYEREKARVY